MSEFYKGCIPIIDCSKERNVALVNPLGVGSGLVKRDFVTDPHQCFGAHPSEIKTLSKADWDAVFDEEEATQSSLEHMFLRNPKKPAFVNLDQDGDGDCWAYSTGHAIMFEYLRMGVPIDEIPRLNPHYIATILRRFNGGWCGASMDVATRLGCCVEGNGPDQWPKWSHNTGLLNQTRADAALKNKVVRNIYDMAKPVYGQTMIESQIATCGLSRTPAPTDYNEMAHSMCQIRWVRIERGSWAPLIINSWLNWGHFGLGVLRNMDADGAVAVLQGTAH